VSDEEICRAMNHWISCTSSNSELVDILDKYKKHQALLRSTTSRLERFRDADDTGSALHFIEQCKRVEAKTSGLQWGLKTAVGVMEGVSCEGKREELVKSIAELNAELINLQAKLSDESKKEA
ncbi:MAG: hypothetical protein Q9174_006228, partial [Haloplaca sp. 1 TL-2023]